MNFYNIIDDDKKSLWFSIFITLLIVFSFVYFYFCWEPNIDTKNIIDDTFITEITKTDKVFDKT